MGKCMFLRKGETHTKPLSGILASDLAVGSTVKLMENGGAVEYLVVNQGIPSASSLYDESCDGTWLLRKNIYESRQWHSSKSVSYKASDIHTYLNGTFLGLFGTNIKNTIKNVKIPYLKGTSGNSTVYSGSNGMETKIFLLSGYEVGFYHDNDFYLYLPEDGAKLSYFLGDDGSSANKVRKASSEWWLRSPGSGSYNVWYITTDGDTTTGGTNCTSSKGIRPALILPSTALFDKTTLILKGVA